MVLNMLNLYSLIFAQFGKIDDMNKILETMKKNETVINNFIQHMPSRNLVITTASPIGNLTDYGILLRQILD